jgi:hypothetical protein
MLIFMKVLEVTYNVCVNKMRLDNSGENIDMADAIRAEGSYNVTFEFISPGSPQYNGVVERMFATLYGMVRSMLNQARLPMVLRHGVWAEAARYATDMRNYLVTAKSLMSSYEKFMGHKFDRIETLYAFGEMAIVEDNPSRGLRSKLQDRGKPALFLGTTHEHTHDTYHFLNLLTNCIIMSRDVIWLQHSYGEYYNISPPTMPAILTRILITKDADGHGTRSSCSSWYT